MSSFLIGVVAALAMLAGSFKLGMNYQEGADAKRIVAQAALDKAATKVAVIEDNKDGVKHAEHVNTLDAKVADTRVRLASLSLGRSCLSSPSISLLNAIGGLPSLPASAGEPASAPQAAASDPDVGQKFATDADIGDAIAICRGEHAKLSDQLNSILDIEERRTSGK